MVTRYAGRIVNVHPSLLPAFPGLHTHRRALEAGVRLHGCTVHFVTPTLDRGPIIVQAAVPVLPDDDEQSLAARVLEQEHRIYPQALAWLAQGRVALVEGRVTFPHARAAPALIAPLLERDPDPVATA
jgi:phosphoribosylglycinamide formyltransferase-1